MKRVYILSKRCIFSHGIETLLAQEPGIEIVGCGKDIHPDADYLHQYRPDVVIINCDEAGGDYIPEVVRILRERFGVTVILLSLENNQMLVYRGEQKQIHHLDHLLTVIRD